MDIQGSVTPETSLCVYSVARTTGNKQRQLMQGFTPSSSCSFKREGGEKYPKHSNPSITGGYVASDRAEKPTNGGTERQSGGKSSPSQVAGEPTAGEINKQSHRRLSQEGKNKLTSGISSWQNGGGSRLDKPDNQDRGNRSQGRRGIYTYIYILI